MARKEMMSISDGQAKMEAVNVDFKVGRGGENRSADVMLIQALFRYISLDQDIARRFLGNMKVPRIDGVCRPVTLQAIKSFQLKHAHSLIRVDGVIHPASYGKRKMQEVLITSGHWSERQMTITRLHTAAWNAWQWLPEPDNDYIAGLIRIEPRLRPYLTHVWYAPIDI